MRSLPTFSFAACFGSFCHLHRYFHLFLSTYVLLDVNFWIFYLIYNINYSVKVSFRQDKYFFVFWCFLSFLGTGFLSSTFYCISRCLPTKRIKTNQGLLSVATFALRLIHTITALPVGNLARVMTPVSRSNLPVKSVLLSENAMSKSKRKTLPLLKMMNSTF